MICAVVSAATVAVVNAVTCAVLNPEIASVPTAATCAGFEGADLRRATSVALET